MSPTVVEVSAAGVAMTVTTHLVHRCPFKDEIDTGQVTLTWLVTGQTFELHSLREWLDTWAEVAVSHEALTVQLQAELAYLVEGVQVVTTWDTAGMAVQCST